MDLKDGGISENGISNSTREHKLTEFMFARQRHGNFQILLFLIAVCNFTGSNFDNSSNAVPSIQIGSKRSQKIEQESQRTGKKSRTDLVEESCEGFENF